MYNSPIELIISDIQHQMIEQQENQIYQSICNAGVNVYKDELVKALQYDRDQYQQGYRDAVVEFAERLVEERLAVVALKDKTEDYSDGYHDALCYVEDKIDELKKEMVGDGK